MKEINPDAYTARGMSRWGFSISSLALVCSSKPIHWKTMTPTTPMITTKSVGKNPPSPPWKPPLSPAITTRTAKNARSASRMMAPRLGTHLGCDEAIGDEERERGDDQPEDCLRAIRRRLADGVEGHDRADREEDHVEAEKRFLELSLLRHELSYCCGFPHWLPSPGYQLTNG